MMEYCPFVNLKGNHFTIRGYRVVFYQARDRLIRSLASKVKFEQTIKHLHADCSILPPTRLRGIQGDNVAHQRSFDLPRSSRCGDTQTHRGEQDPDDETTQDNTTPASLHSVVLHDASSFDS